MIKLFVNEFFNIEDNEERLDFIKKNNLISNKNFWDEVSKSEKIEKLIRNNDEEDEENNDEEKENKINNFVKNFGEFLNWTLFTDTYICYSDNEDSIFDLPYSERLDLDVIVRELELSEKWLEENENLINWTLVSRYQSFGLKFFRKFKHKLVLEELKLNERIKAFDYKQFSMELSNHKKLFLNRNFYGGENDHERALRTDKFMLKLLQMSADVVKRQKLFNKYITELQYEQTYEQTKVGMSKTTKKIKL